MVIWHSRCSPLLTPSSKLWETFLFHNSSCPHLKRGWKIFPPWGVGRFFSLIREWSCKGNIKSCIDLPFLKFHYSGFFSFKMLLNYLKASHLSDFHQSYMSTDSQSYFWTYFLDMLDFLICLSFISYLSDSVSLFAGLGLSILMGKSHI